MASMAPNAFTTWDLTPEEEHQGAIYTITQLQVLQNLLAANAEEKLYLAPDPKAPERFIQDEAYKRGQIELLQWMIDNSLALTNPEPIEA